MRRGAYFAGGLLSLLLGAVGLLLPLLPTVPFMVLAAFCFARSDPRLEHWLLSHPRFGPHIRAWRQRGAISRRGKTAAAIALALSSAVGLALLEAPWSLIPLTACMAAGAWILTRPSE